MTTPIVELLNGVSAWENRNRSNQNFAALLQIIEEKGFVWQGDYVDAWQYIKWDIVKYNYSLYIAKIPTIGLIPTNNSAWDLLVESFQGETGPTGPQGTWITSIVRTSGTGSPGSFDTYTITFSNATTTTFQVWNGSNGTWTWDVVWPASSTDNAVARFDLATWKLLQNSLGSVNDSGWFLSPSSFQSTDTSSYSFVTNWGLTFHNPANAAIWDGIAQNELLKFTKTTSAVNEFTIANAATGNWPTLSATGWDTNIDINIATKGTWVVKVNWASMSDFVKSQFTTINSQTGTTYTFVLTDAWAMVTFNNAAAQTITVPPNSSVAFPIGTQIDLAQLGAGKVTFAEWAGVTIQSKGSNKAISAQYVGATLKKIGTDTWLLLGDLIA